MTSRKRLSSRMDSSMPHIRQEKGHIGPYREHLSRRRLAGRLHARRTNACTAPDLSLSGEGKMSLVSHVVGLSTRFTLKTSLVPAVTETEACELPGIILGEIEFPNNCNNGNLGFEARPASLGGK